MPEYPYHPTYDVEPIDEEYMLHNTDYPDFHAVQSIQLGELIQDGIFTWERVGWHDAAYSQEQYDRLCEAFETRFYFREIGMLPVKKWLMRLSQRLKTEIMPKYRPMYAQLESGAYNPLQAGGEYSKKREIDSQFPESLLDGSNETYASSGKDTEEEIVKLDGKMSENYASYLELFVSVDKAILDELETLFTCIMTANANGL